MRPLIAQIVTAPRGRFFIVGAGVALLAYLSTLQLVINGSGDPFVTDTGEIQNALARWGTIHYNGYPLYTAVGSVFVTLLRALGVVPAVSSSLYSALWGAASVALLIGLLLEIEVTPPLATVGALIYALAASIWIDASIAEVHTMSMALTFAALWAAVRYGRRGEIRSLYWLAFLVGQTLAHQRAFALFLPGIVLMIHPRWSAVWRRLPALAGLALLGPLTYLYLPVRAWMGADWTYSSPGTWDGFWALVFYTRSDLVEIPSTAAGWWTRIAGLIDLLRFDLPWPLLITGLAGIWTPGTGLRRSERAAFTLSWLLSFPVSFIVWEGYVSDALLAVKLPVVAMAALGAGVGLQGLTLRRPRLKWAALAVGVLVVAALFASRRPAVLEITRDASARQTIALGQAVPAAPDGRPITLMALWGNDFWQLAYAQAYEGAFPHLNLVDHNANFAAIVERGDHLYTLSRTFFRRPLAWWAEELGGAALSGVAPGVVAIRPEPQTAPPSGEPLAALDNGIIIREAEVRWAGDDTLSLDVSWQAAVRPEADYSVAVHLVDADPPAGPQNILAQADRVHPVEGWYPTSGWQAGEVVREVIPILVPPDSDPTAVRVGMYRVAADGSFVNYGWLSLPMPAGPRP